MPALIAELAIVRSQKRPETREENLLQHPVLGSSEGNGSPRFQQCEVPFTGFGNGRKVGVEQRPVATTVV